MSIVSPTDSSKYYGRKRSGIYGVQDQEQSNRARAGISPYGQEARSEDHLDLTEEAKHVLEKIRHEFNEVLQDFPQFRSFFPEAAESQSHRGDLAVMSQARRFLINPVNQGRSRHEEDFAAFYRKINDLALQHNHAMAQLQRELRRDPAGLYSR